MQVTGVSYLQAIEISLEVAAQGYRMSAHRKYSWHQMYFDIVGSQQRILVISVLFILWVRNSLRLIRSLGTHS